jgi:hypothetical protein
MPLTPSDPWAALVVIASQQVRPQALLRSFESLLLLRERLLQIPEVSLEALDVPLIPGASQAFTLRFLTQALTFAMVVRTSLALQLELLCEALEFPLELQVWVLPH